MADRISIEIAVFGGGVIGLATAHRLRSHGHEVVVIEPNAPGSGASYGNAGTIADYAVIPVGTPAVLRNLPPLIFNRDSPLAIRTAVLPTLLPWLVRFACQSLPANARRNAAAIAALLADAPAAWRDLAMEIGAGGLIRQRGALYLYASKSAFAAASSDMAMRREHGIAQEVLTADEIGQLEPRLPPFEGGGILFPNAMHLADPGQMMTCLASAAQAAGVAFLSAHVQGLGRTGAGVRIVTPDHEVTAKAAVIAAGAHSKPLALQAGDHVPLDTERGYHLEFDTAEPPVTRPVCPTAGGFYLTPMTGRLRVAGTVELGGLTAPPNPRRLAVLERGARAIFPGLGSPSRSWLGFRPSMPSSVPLIRASAGGRDIILAFGHGHLGLTLAPVTARKVQALLA